MGTAQLRPRLRSAARGDRRATAGHRTDRTADRSGGRARAGDGAGPAPLPSGARDRPGTPGRTVAARDRGDLARGGAGRRARARPRTGAGAGRAVRAVARPDGRAARRGRSRVPGTGVGVGQVAAARCTSAAPRCRRADTDDHCPGRRRPAVVRGRARGPGPGHRRGGAAPAHGRRRRGRPRLVGRGRGHDGAAGGGATRPAADARRGAPARRAERAVVDGRCRRRRCRRQAGCLPDRRGHGAGPPARAVPARRCRPPDRSGVGRRPARAARARAGCARHGDRGGRRGAARGPPPPVGGPAVRAGRGGRRGGAGGAGPQGVRPGRQRAARPVHRCHGIGEERAAADAGTGPGRHPLVGRAEPRAGRLQGRCHLPRPREPPARLRRDHQPGGRAVSGRSDGGCAGG